MKIGVIGSGDVGQTLGAGFAGLGHDVMLGTREPQSEKANAWASRVGKRASTGTCAEAAVFADIAILATNWQGTENAVQLAGATRLAGKILIDVVNPFQIKTDGTFSLAIGLTDSASEQIQRWLPNTRVVKTFNTVGKANMVRPTFAGGPPSMWVCGNDEAAKRAVSDFLKVLGWEAIDVGPLDRARSLEPMALLWVQLAMAWKSDGHAFKLLKH